MEGAHYDGGHAGDAFARLMVGRDTKWYKGRMLLLNLCIALLLITSMTNGYDGSMMNGLQTLGTWQGYFGNPQGSTLGIFNAIQSIGGIVGLPIAPILSDRLGRRMTIFIGSIIMLIGVAVQTAAQNTGMFIGCRFLIGFGLSFACLAAPVLITELAFPTHRGPLTSLYNSTWYLGSIIAAWTTFGTFRIPNTWGWRIPSVLQGLPSVLQVIFIFMIPESPRWLVDKGKDEKALQIIQKWHCRGDPNDPLLEFEYNEIKEALRLEKLANKNSSYIGLFRGKGNLKRMRVIIAIAFFSQWSGNGIVSYYLSKALTGIGITSEFDQNLINGILQIYNWGTAIVGALVVEKAGRRTLFLTSTAGMCVSYMVWTICNAVFSNSATLDAAGNPTGGNKNAGNAVLASIFFYYGFYNIAMSPLLVSYTVEILPFRVRSKGLMVMQMCVNASLVFNQYVNPIAMGALGWKYYIVYTVWIAFEFVYLYFTVIETKGKDGPLPLEEISRLFDGEDAAQEVAFGASANAGHDLNPAGTPPLDEKKGSLEAIEHNEQKPTHTLSA